VAANSQPREMREVDLGERGGASFDVTEDACQQKAMAAPTRRKKLGAQPLGSRQPLLDRGARDGARLSRRRHPGRGVHDGSLDPDGRQVPSRMEIGCRAASGQMKPHAR